jgi:hypothetical protein
MTSESDLREKNICSTCSTCSTWTGMATSPKMILLAAARKALDGFGAFAQMFLSRDPADPGTAAMGHS